MIRTKYNSTKAFLKRYQVPLALTTGVVVGYAVTRDMKSNIVNEQIEKLTTWNLENELNQWYLEEFVENKGLQDEFFKFREQVQI